MATAALAVVAVGALAALDLLRIRADVLAAQDRLVTLDLTTAGSADALTALTTAADRDVQRAVHRAETSPWLQVVRVLPVVRQQVDAVRDLSGAAAEVTALARTTIRDLTPALDRAGDEPSARIDLVDAALDELDDVTAGLDRVEPRAGGWLVPPLAGARSDLVERLAKAGRDLDDARRSLQAVRRFLSGPGDYLVLAANQAEMTAGSGMPLSAGIAHVVDGDIDVGEFVPTSDVWLGNNGIPLPDDLNRLYAAMGMGADFRGTTATPDFPAVGARLAAMAAKSPLGPVDGVFVVDSVVLRTIVELTGPVTVGGRSYDASSIEREILNGNYLRFARFDQRDQRTAFQSDIAHAVFEALKTEHVDPARLAGGISNAAKGRHFLAWSPDPDLQDLWAQVGASGALTDDGLLISLQNYDGNKLDFYLQPWTALDVDVLTDGSRQVTLTIALANEPRDPTTAAIEGIDPNYHWVFLDVHLPRTAYGIEIEAKRPRQQEIGVDRGYPVATAIYPVPLDGRATAIVRFSLPAEPGALTLLPSARYRPLILQTPSGKFVNDAVAVTVDLPERGWLDRVGPVGAAVLLLLGAAGFVLSAVRGQRALAGDPNPAPARAAKVRYDAGVAVVLLAIAVAVLVVNRPR